MNWLKKLFGMADRTAEAFDRTEKAWVEIAVMSETLRDSMRSRFAIEDYPTQAALEAAAELPAAGSKRGRKADVA